MRCHRIAAWLTGLAVVLLPGSPTSAQDENHYKVYTESATEIPALIPVTLRDQFGQVIVDIIQRTRFATPVSKDGSMVFDGRAHQSWFALFVQPQPLRRVEVTDQFGTSEWQLGDVAYLVAPALKRPQPGETLPVRNHYLCYQVTSGPAIGKQVTLVDQFGQVQVTVLRAILFCNPVEKVTQDGTVYPIVDSLSHLACYAVDDPTTYGVPVLVLDQFGSPEMNLVNDVCLCNPAIKGGPTGARRSTWGQIKGLYR